MEILRRTVVFDAADIDVESSFWAAVFGGEAVGDDEWRTVTAPDGTVPVGVQLAPEHLPVSWPESPVRTHLDLWVADIAAAHAEIVSLGAGVVQRAEGEQNFNVYSSPAGHPFCLCW